MAMDHSGFTAYQNGEWIPLSQLSIPVWDLGFTQGIAVSEHLRSYGGKLPLLEFHLKRLQRGARAIGIDFPVAESEFRRIVGRVCDENLPKLPFSHELAICAVITGGSQPRLTPPNVSDSPRFLVYAYPLPLFPNSQWLREGVRLATSSIREIPAESLPKDFKSRNRLHYHLATRDVRACAPDCQPLLLDQFENVAETPIASVVIYVADEGLVVPPAEQILDGVTLGLLVERVSQSTSTAVVRRPFRREEIFSADEAIWVGSTVTVMPITSLDGQPIGDGSPGPVSRQMLDLWSAAVGVDLAQQFRDAKQESGE